ncbi:MAG TPA: nuclear transport factor 2 family protein [Solirubrobacterales bacterium]|nr:nuclear transport factor 2 family protein [Solirubrobacterales bacterium]
MKSPSALGSAPATAVPETPGGALKAFVGAIEQGNVALAATCVSRDGCLITPDATAINGRDAIRAILNQLVKLRLRVEGNSTHWVVAGDIALGRGVWQSRSEHNGTELAQQWNATIVLRRRDQAWRIQIIAPWEAAS